MADSDAFEYWRRIWACSWNRLADQPSLRCEPPSWTFDASTCGLQQPIRNGFLLGAGLGGILRGDAS
jgi:hypothetical protein